MTITLVDANKLKSNWFTDFLDQSLMNNVLVAMSILGMGLLKMSLSDIVFTVFEADFDAVQTSLGNYVPDDKVDVLMSKGMAFYPSFVLTHLPSADQKTIKLVKIANGSVDHTMETAVKTIFIVYLYGFIIGSVPTNDSYIPKIISDSFGTGLKPFTMAKTVFSCNLAKLDLSWIKEFPLAQLPDKMKNRLALSSAGYRYLAAFVQVVLIPTTPENVKILQKDVSQYLETGLFWDVHPIFKSSANITKYGSFNKSIEGIIAKYGEKDSIADLVSTKALDHTPISQKIDQKIFKFNKDDFSKNPIDFNKSIDQSVLQIINDMNK